MGLESSIQQPETGNRWGEEPGLSLQGFILFYFSFLMPNRLCFPALVVFSVRLDLIWLLSSLLLSCLFNIFLSSFPPQFPPSLLSFHCLSVLSFKLSISSSCSLLRLISSHLSFHFLSSHALLSRLSSSWFFSFHFFHITTLFPLTCTYILFHLLHSCWFFNFSFLSLSLVSAPFTISIFSPLFLSSVHNKPHCNASLPLSFSLHPLITAHGMTG